MYEFGRFRFDPDNHLLASEGNPVSLTPKAFEILLILVQNGARLTTKEELMRKVWPDSFVEEANLTVNISALRKLLGETPNGQQYIETVPKRGYRFAVPVMELQNKTPTSDVPSPFPVAREFVQAQNKTKLVGSAIKTYPRSRLLSGKVGSGLGFSSVDWQ